ncbi:MAG: hypothetical protein KJN84_07605 [Bacteroidia bacterium]|nr:hypothetical protein [Bacteroidia bacterium]
MRFFLFILLSAFLLSCNSEKATSVNKLNEVNVRMDKEPGLINPFYAPTSQGRTVYQYIFLPLADYHPETLELTPILIEEIPEGSEVEIDGEKRIAYDINFRDDAKWPDGTSVTAKDYLLAVLMIKHPKTLIVGWQPYFAAMKKIELDDNDPRHFKIFLDPNYMVGKEAAVTSSVMPAHKFDPNNILIGKQDLIFGENYETSDSAELKVVEEINNSRNHKKEIFQNGPYTITDFQTDEFLILDAKKDYWGQAYPNNPFLQSNSDRIVIRVVPDEVAAINMAKDGRLDFLNMKSSDAFFELKNNPETNKDWTFHVPPVRTYYFLSLNNRSPIFRDRGVRRAIAHLVDVEDIIENIDGGLGMRTTGPFHPSRSYYDESLSPIKYDPELASKMLSELGWNDSDGNGIRDKVVDGKKEELSLEFLYTGSNLAKSIGLLFQESAKSAGVELTLVSKKMGLMRKENLNIYNYDMAALAITSDEAPDDHYSRWHSDNAIPGKRNVSGYSNKDADKLIETIRTTRDTDLRKEKYKELQKVMYDDQPVIFLYCPLQKMMINNRLDAKATSKRPGYLANTFKLKN